MRLIIKLFTYGALLSLILSFLYLISGSAYSITLNWDTVIYVVSSTLLSIIIGTYSAWYLVLYDVPHKKMFNVMYLMPMIFPTYIMAFMYSNITSIHGISALIFVTVLTSFPYVYMIMKSHVGSLTYNHIYTAQSLKVKDIVLKRDVLFPLIKPGLILSSAVVMADTLSEFGASVFYNINTLTVIIYEQWFTLYNPTAATGAMTILMLIVLVIFVLKFKLLRWNNIINPIITSNKEHITPFKLAGGHKWFVMTLLIVPLIFALVLPLWTLNEWLVLSYRNADWKDVLITAMSTSTFSSITAILTVCLSLLVLYLFKGSWQSNVIMALNYAIPGIVLSISAIHLGLSTIWVILWVFVVKYSMLSYSSLSGQINKIDRRLYYSAKSLKKSSFWYVINVQMPLSINSIIIGIALVFVDVLRELPIMLTLRPPGFETLSTKVFYYYDSEMMYMSAPYITLMLLISAPLLYHIRNK